MSITEVKIQRISKEEKYYRQKAEQYLEEYETTIVKYKVKRTIRNIFYKDNSSIEEKGKKNDEYIYLNEYDTWDEAFEAAKKHANADKSQLNVSVQPNTNGGKVVFEVFMGNELPPRGRVLRPNEAIPPSRSEYWRYIYEIIEK